MWSLARFLLLGCLVAVWVVSNVLFFSGRPSPIPSRVTIGLLTRPPSSRRFPSRNHQPSTTDVPRRPQPLLPTTSSRHATVRVPIDGVITYVSDTELQWKKEFTYYARQRATKQFGEEDALAQQFRDWGEWKYALESTLRYLPWMRRIFFVVSTLEQVPISLRTPSVYWKTLFLAHNKSIDRDLRFVTHEDLCRFMQNHRRTTASQQGAFPLCEEMLPTFKSTTIEALIGFLEDLSEDFVLLNNDLIIGSHVAKSDLFIADANLLDHSCPRVAPFVLVEPIAEETVIHRRKRTSVPSIWEGMLEFNKRQAQNILSHEPLPNVLAHVPRGLQKQRLRNLVLGPSFGSLATRLFSESRFRTSTDMMITLLHGEVLREECGDKVVQMVNHVGSETSSSGLSYRFVMASSKSQLLQLLSELRRSRPQVLALNDNFPQTVDNETMELMQRVMKAVVE